ncbi:MAG: SDR family oxidoreductase [Planctomycetota bacterium]|nr:MAG: SDR family oxidoreductase [Planctomycetota bacterium]
MPTLVISGANRGLGLELTRQYLEDGWRVHAACRRPEQAQELGALAQRHRERLTVHALDVTDHERVAELGRALSGETLDLVFSNAGVLLDRGESALEVRAETLARSFEINATGAFLFGRAFLEGLARSERPVLAAMTSRMGSIGDNTSGGYYAYRASKAALNMLWRTLAHELRPRGICCVLLHPGWVRTRMGSKAAPLEPAESARGLRAVLARLTLQDTGRFFSYDGTELPW